jgi:hypothetical protein
MNFFFSVYLILPTALDPGVYSASNRNEYKIQKKMFQGIRARPVSKADKFTAICDCLDNVGTYRPPRPVTGTLYFVLFTFFRPVVFILFRSHTPRCNFLSTLYPRSYWYIIQSIIYISNKLNTLKIMYYIIIYKN